MICVKLPSCFNSTPVVTIITLEKVVLPPMFVKTTPGLGTLSLIRAGIAIYPEALVLGDTEEPPREDSVTVTDAEFVTLGVIVTE